MLIAYAQRGNASARGLERKAGIEIERAEMVGYVKIKKTDRSKLFKELFLRLQFKQQRKI